MRSKAIIISSSVIIATAALALATGATNITYSGTVTYTGGTGKFEDLTGSGTIQCTTTDAGAHKSCTVNSTTTQG